MVAQDTSSKDVNYVYVGTTQGFAEYLAREPFFERPPPQNVHAMESTLRRPALIS